MLIFFSALFLTSCKENKVEEGFRLIGKKFISKESIKLDSITLDVGVNSNSFFLKEINKKIYFIDRLFGLIKVFDSAGHLENTFLGKRKFPQLGELYTISFLDNCFFVTDNIFVYKLDKNFKFLESSRIKFKPNILNFDSDNPDPNQIMFYELNYGAMKSFEGFKNYLIIPIEMELPKLNAFNTNKYYKIAYNFGLLNCKTFKVEQVFNNWPASYTKNKNYPFLTSNSYDLNRNQIYINQEADTSIYVYNTELKPLFKFGFKPENINDKYKETKKLSEAFDPLLPKKFKNKFGYFKQVIVTDDVIVRFFKSGNAGSNNKLGLQVYKKFNLINEFMLNKNVEILGYISPYFLFYSKINNSKLIIYKLKINNEKAT